MARVIRNFKRKDNAVEVNEYKIGSSEDYVNVTDPFAANTSTNTTISLKTFLQKLKTNITKLIRETTFTAQNGGSVPAPTTSKNTTSYFLNGAGSWTIPYSNFTSSTNGLVKAPGSATAASTGYILTGNNSFKQFSSFPTATTNVAGLMSATDKAKLNGIAKFSAYSGGPAGNQTPAFGETFTIYKIDQSTSGQISGTAKTVKIPNSVASETAAGLMSATDKTKLKNIANNATHNTFSRFVSSVAAANPSFGESFNIAQTIQSTAGQLSENLRAIKIPNTEATTSKAGLMSAADKTFINNASQGLQLHSSGVATGTTSRGLSYASLSLIVVYVKFTTSGGLPVCVSFVIPPDIASKIGTHTLTTNWPSAYDGYVTLQVTKGSSTISVNISAAYDGKTDRVNNAQMYVYYMKK